MDEVRHVQTQKGAERPPTMKGSQGTAKPQNPQCKQCGHERHPAEKCYAKNATCYKCNRKVNASQRPQQHLHTKLVWTTANLGPVTSHQDPAWATTVLLGTKEVQFKLDAGAEVTAIWEVTYKKLDALPLAKTFQSLMWVDPSKPEGLRTVHWSIKGIVPHKLFLLSKKPAGPASNCLPTAPATSGCDTHWRGGLW